MAGVSVFCKEERRDDWKKADMEDTVSPCTPSEDLEDLERNRRNDSDVGATERLSSLERKKRAVLTTSAIADTLPTEGFLEAGDLLDCLKKDWRRPAR